MASANNRTDYEIGRDNVEFLGLEVHKPVFFVSSLTIIAFVVGVLAFRDAAAGVFDSLYAWLVSTFDWVFMGTLNILLLFCLLLLVTPVGRVRLGGPDARPDYSIWSWFAMLFAAGIGIGLMFYGVAEPVQHFLSPPLGVDPADTAAARNVAMAATIFHWGIQPWALYAVVALALAFSAYNLRLPLTIRAAFHPLLGKAVWGRFGHVIDIMAVFATLFGLATSLGLGSQQLAAGLAHLFGVPDTDATRVLVIAVVTFIATVSVVSGMDRGIKRLSQANLVLALMLLAFVLAVGPTLDVFAGFVGSIGHYLAQIGPLSNWVGRDDLDFLHGWTTFFWAWWISWAPFVGLFIARVSRGRTVRQLVGCMLVVPVLLSALWFNAFGATALSMHIDGGQTAVVDAVAVGRLELGLFGLLEALPLGAITSGIAIVLVAVFFITSSDSGSLVIDTITAGGKMDTPVGLRVFWCTFEGLVAITLLVSGGLVALQTAALITGFPFALLVLLMCISVWKGLRAAARPD
ncbi:MAG: BCCT family transporter [Gemmatimonadetes bacterium]|nr:BCCT family transporter [Gemmatimonadota bacterium]